MKLSKFHRLVSLMCVVFMMCVIVAPAAAAANYDDQISPHFTSCPDCGGDMDRIWMRDHYSNKYTLGVAMRVSIILPGVMAMCGSATVAPPL